MAVHLGDCLDVLPTLAASSIDLVLADMPYGTTRNYWDQIIPFDALWLEIKRVVKPGGVVVLTAQGPFVARVIMSNELWFKYKVVWEKSKPTNFLNAKKQPLRKHEDICVFYESAPTYNPQMSAGKPYNKGVRKDQGTGSYNGFNPSEVSSPGERYPTDVVYFRTAESEGAYHPTQKPVDLCRYLIRTYSNPGDVVLDFCMGSGTTGVAAKAEDRRFIGIERDPEHFNTACNRLGIEHDRAAA